MKKNKKIRTSIVLSAILGSAVAGVSAGLINNSSVLNNANSTSIKQQNTSTKSTTYNVNFGAHTINGISLHPDQDLIQSGAKECFKIYSNTADNHAFPTWQSAFIIVEGQGRVGWDWRLEQPSSWTIVAHEGLQYALAVERPQPNANLNSLLSFTGSGPYQSAATNLVCNVGDAVPISDVKITSNDKPNPGNIEFHAEPVFPPNKVPPKEWMTYEWFAGEAGKEQPVPGQTGPDLVLKTKDFTNGAQISVKCIAKYSNQSKESQALNLKVVSSNELQGITPTSSDSSYMWAIVGSVGGVVLIGAITAVLIILKKKKEQQAKLAKRTNVARPAAPRLNGGTVPPKPAGAPGPRPMNPGMAANAKPGVNSTSRQAVNLQRPTAPAPAVAKVDVKAQPASLAPKKK